MTEKEEKCYFCGDNKAREGLNRVKYRLVHPNRPLHYRLFHYKPWIYCCEDCFKYMQRLWGAFEYE